VKVLLASWSWYPVGGDWTYVENVKRLYESKGYEVVPFSTKNEKNIPTDYDEYFIKSYDYKVLNANKGIKSGFNALKNSVVSFEALKNLDALLQNNEIAFAHLNIIHHWLTPAIVWKLKQYNIPVIWSLHEYKLICPEGSFVSDGKICEKCYENKFYHCALQKCKKQSFLASMLASLDAYFYHLSGVYKKVDFYLCPSEFLLKKFAQFGFDSKKLVLSNLCYDIPLLDESVQEIQRQAARSEGQHQERFILYVGRIEKIKGILTLIDAVKGTDIRLKIAGTGPALAEMQAYVSANQMLNVEFLGHVTKKKVYELTLQSECVVCPSEWYENYPFSVIESLLMSKPVIGANIGGIPELVLDGQTGLLFEPGDALALRKNIRKIWEDPAYGQLLGARAREHAWQKVNAATHWNMLSSVIDQLPVKNSSRVLSE
jgi:glycosyltransferase involved in cell wall biosynthesis